MGVIIDDHFIKRSELFGDVGERLFGSAVRRVPKVDGQKCLVGHDIARDTAFYMYCLYCFAVFAAVNDGTPSFVMVERFKHGPQSMDRVAAFPWTSGMGSFT